MLNPYHVQNFHFRILTYLITFTFSAAVKGCNHKYLHVNIKEGIETSSAQNN